MELLINVNVKTKFEILIKDKFQDYIHNHILNHI